MVVGSSPAAVTSNFGPVLSKEFLDIHATIEYGFTLKHVRDMKEHNLYCFKKYATAPLTTFKKT